MTQRYDFLTPYLPFVACEKFLPRTAVFCPAWKHFFIRIVIWCAIIHIIALYLQRIVINPFEIGACDYCPGEMQKFSCLIKEVEISPGIQNSSCNNRCRSFNGVDRIIMIESIDQIGPPLLKRDFPIGGKQRSVYAHCCRSRDGCFNLMRLDAMLMCIDQCGIIINVRVAVRE